MATIIKKVIAPVAKVAPKMVAKVAPKVTQKAGFDIVDMDTIQLVPKGGGGGRGLSEFSAKVFGLPNGKGFKITDEQYGENGKGLASTYAGAARRNIKLRVRRDTNGQLWLFRVSEEDENAYIENKAAKQAANQAA